MFRTLLVEDNAPFRMILKDNLQSEFPSMDISEAGDGTEALEIIRSSPPNLVFMDVRLPGQNGLELTRMIKTDYPHITVIVLTSYDLPDYRQRAAELGTVCFLVKGQATPEEILNLVKNYSQG